MRQCLLKTALNFPKSRKNAAILDPQTADVLFVFIHIPASNVFFLTSLSRVGSTRDLLSMLERFAAVRRIVEKRSLRLCQSNLGPLFVFIQISGCTFIFDLWGAHPLTDLEEQLKWKPLGLKIAVIPMEECIELNGFSIPFPLQFR
jgi:hypothetical protein